MKIAIKIRLKKDSDKIEVKTKIDNKTKDHRVRFIIPTGYKSTESVSDNQFGTIKRPVIDTANEVWEKEKWKEKPIPVYQMMSFVDLNDKKSGLSVLTNGLREYEITGENYDEIALTLFRSIGLLGKEEMYYRPGRPSGIKIPTPDSQMIGEWEFDFAVFIHESDEINGLVPQIAKEYITPVYIYNKIPYNAMRLNSAGFNTPTAYSLFEKDIKGSILSTVKKSEKDSSILVRLYNPNIDREISDKLNLRVNYSDVFETNLNENKIAEIKENEVKFSSCEVKTIGFHLKK